MDKPYYNLRISKRWARVSLAVLVAALIAVPVTAIASHSFTDVPDSHTFHNDIAWLADADVTKGCNPPANDEFCPEDEVTRGAMAAFMRRFAQYIDAEDGTPAQADNASTLDNYESDDFVLQPQLLHATVAVDGGLRQGSAISSTRSSTGIYEVTFGRSLNNCSATASSGTTNENVPYNIGITYTVLLNGSQATVRTANSYVAPGVSTYDAPFHVIVVCPAGEPVLPMTSSDDVNTSEPDSLGEVLP